MKQYKKKYIWASIGRIVLLSIVAIIFGVSVYNWNAKKITGNQLPMPFGYGISVVLSGSMEPRLSVDDLVIIKQVDEVKVDDVIVFQDGKSLVIHRAIEINDDSIITKGDANNAEDTPIQIKDVKGVLVHDIPYMGMVINFIKQPIIIVALLVLAIFLTERSFRKEKAKDRDELDDIKKEIELLIEELQNNK